GGGRCDDHWWEFSPRIRRRHAVQPMAHPVLRGDSDAGALLRRLGDFCPLLGVRRSRRISSDAGDGGLGVCPSARAVRTDDMYQGSTADHLVAAFRGASSCGDRLWLDPAPYGVLGWGHFRPAPREML